MKVLFIGDIVGKSGRQAISKLLPRILKSESIDFCIANVENAAGGLGVTPDVVFGLIDNGIDVLTSGNHIFDKKSVIEIIDKEDRLIRPLNYPSTCPGSGYNISYLKGNVSVVTINISGRVFMESIDCPFKVISEKLKDLGDSYNIIIVDFHAEATSEKIAMGYYLDGKVSAVIGTHTHVQTADEKILPNGTGYITDVGMTAAFDSVIGMTKEKALARFLTKMPQKFEVAKKDKRLSGVIIEIDPLKGITTGIKRVFESAEDYP